MILTKGCLLQVKKKKELQQTTTTHNKLPLQLPKKMERKKMEEGEANQDEDRCRDS